MHDAGKNLGLEMDIDHRLQELWEVIGYVPRSEEAVSYLRMAYGLGWRDALREDARGERGRLARDNGLGIPT